MELPSTGVTGASWICAQFGNLILTATAQIWNLRYKRLVNLVPVGQLARMEGRMEGLAESLGKGRMEVAKSMAQRGMDWEIIAACTGLSRETIVSLANQTP